MLILSKRKLKILRDPLINKSSNLLSITIYNSIQLLMYTYIVGQIIHCIYLYTIDIITNNDYKEEDTKVTYIKIGFSYVLGCIG